jgi:hypothetical protein
VFDKEVVPKFFSLGTYWVLWTNYIIFCNSLEFVEPWLTPKVSIINKHVMAIDIKEVFGPDYSKKVTQNKLPR